ncbi:fumarate hydratase C-terminal domain-containing protein [Candidatus Bathyarchaeota archaeon]|nr:fumarate hydratase C-terminal domain-containing protein [Candidatus Bathyarchaeota archaeon]
MQTKTPFSLDFIKKLSIGDEVYLTGEVITIRDMASARAIEYKLKSKPIPVKLDEAVIYHCGPIVKKINEEWKVISAGPTTSVRMENLTSQLIKLFKIRMVIGKGGVGKEATKALQEYGGVYCAFTGGAGVAAAKMIKKVINVEWLDLGIPEALWVFKVENFGPLIVAIDSKGNNLYEEVKMRLNEKLKNLRREKLG